jgi:hypothetical protein
MSKVIYEIDGSKVPASDKCDHARNLRVSIKYGLAQGWLTEKANTAHSPRSSAKSKRGELSKEHLSKFEAFWQAFGYKKGKKEAMQSWAMINELDAVFDQIMKAARRECDNRGEIIGKGGTPKFAQGWLTAERWLDYEDSTAGVTAFRSDEAPDGWEAFWLEHTGFEPKEKNWFSISPSIRAEILTEMKKKQ